MCAAALRLLHLLKIKFAAYNERFGGCGSVLDAHKSYMSEDPLEIEQMKEFRAECVLMLRRFYVRRNDRAPNPKRKANRVVKPVL